jgi:hypothetical protein
MEATAKDIPLLAHMKSIYVPQQFGKLGGISFQTGCSYNENRISLFFIACFFLQNILVDICQGSLLNKKRKLDKGFLFSVYH